MGIWKTTKWFCRHFGVKIKWPKSEEFSDFHSKKWCECVLPRAPQAPFAKIAGSSSRLAVTDDDGFPIYASFVPFYNPLIEIYP